MKVRTGFVSNSSSSSFILVGYQVPENNEELPPGIRSYYLGDGYGVGVVIASDLNEMEPVSRDINDIVDVSTLVQEKLNRTDKPQLIYGSRPC